jgi:hypothetical protein
MVRCDISTTISPFICEGVYIILSQDRVGRIVDQVYRKVDDHRNLSRLLSGNELFPVLRGVDEDTPLIAICCGKMDSRCILPPVKVEDLYTFINGALLE